MTKLADFINSYKENIEKLNISSLKINHIFFFDESNNIKKGIIGYDKDNNADLENLYFVLGGIAIENTLDFNDLLKYVGARQTPVDAKFNFFAFKHNDFLESINQSRLRKFFEYLLKNKILIHFDVLHYMYFALTDILDSLIEENDANQFAALMFYKQIQSDMTEVLYQDYDELHSLLVKYEFPNVPQNKANSFIRDVLDLYTYNYEKYDPDDIENFTKELLRQIIKAKKDKSNLIFLEGNEPYVISSDVFSNYISRMMEINDKKYFDNEASITKQLNEFDADYENKLDVHFLDSKTSREIQICDVICGFVARLYNFLSHNDKVAIFSFVKGLDKKGEAFKTLKTFVNLMTISDNISHMMFKKTNPLFIEERFTLFIKLLEE